MRIALPEEHRSNPLIYIVQHYAQELIASGAAFSTGYQSACLSLREFEGARARTAEINGCRVYRNAVLDKAFYQEVSNWRVSSLYTERERLAIGYAEKMGTDPQALARDEVFWERLKADFSDREIVDLSFCVAAWMGLGRVTHVLGLDDVCSIRSMAAQD